MCARMYVHGNELATILGGFSLLLHISLLKINIYTKFFWRREANTLRTEKKKGY